MERLQLAKVPGAEASLTVFGNYGRQIFLVISIITVISSNNATLLTAPRVLYGMARDHLLPRRPTSVNQGGTPAWALFLCLIVSIALIFSGTFETLIAIDSVIIGAIYVSGFASLLALRRREPNLARPYKTWWCRRRGTRGFRLLGAVQSAHPVRTEVAVRHVRILDAGAYR